MGKIVLKSILKIENKIVFKTILKIVFQNTFQKSTVQRVVLL